MENLLYFLPSCHTLQDLPAACSLNGHFSRSLSSTISFLNNHWILMTPATVLSLANEVEWQSAGNNNLKSRVCLVMEIPYHMKHGYVWGLPFHSILISQVHANMWFALTLSYRLDSLLHASASWVMLALDTWSEAVVHCPTCFPHFISSTVRKEMCVSISRNVFRNSSETQL